MRIFLMIILLTGFCSFQKTAAYSFQEIKTNVKNTLKEHKKYFLDSFVITLGTTVLFAAGKILYNVIKGNQWRDNLEKFLLACTPAISVTVGNRAWDLHMQNKQKEHDENLRQAINNAIKKAKEEEKMRNRDLLDKIVMV